MKILLTGATGFIGRPLLPLLASRGHSLRAVVRRPTPLPEAVETVQVGNIGPETDWQEALAGMEAVVHLAARVHVMDEQDQDPLGAFRTANVQASERLARAAATAGVRRLVYLSSIKVNGEATSDRPFRETDTPAPQDAYGLSKWEAEQALMQVARETGLEVVILRPPLVYGPGVKANFLKLMGMAARGLPLPLASVHNRRSLVYVGNLADVIARCLDHPSATGKTFLACDGEDLSTPELFSRLARLLRAPDRLLPFPVPLLRLAGKLLGKSAEIDRLTTSLMVDNSALRAELGWQPPFSLEEGLEETAKWYLGREHRCSTHLYRKQP